MKRNITTIVSVLFVLTMSSSCVSQSEFDEFSRKMTYQLEILACESRVDIYEAKMKSNEPDPTRRDEPLSTRRDEPSGTRHDEPSGTRHDDPSGTRHDDPSGTRRDLESCEAEFDRVTGTHRDTGPYLKCQPKLKKCVGDGTHGYPKCNTCYDVCMATKDGTWPNATCSGQ